MIEFHSKSASRLKVLEGMSPVIMPLEIIPDKHILICGEIDSSKANLFGFECHRFEEGDNLTLIVKSCAFIIVSEIITEWLKTVSAFACEYGVPIIWVGDASLSSSLGWRVQKMPSSITQYKFWETVLRWVK